MQNQKKYKLFLIQQEKQQIKFSFHITLPSVNLQSAHKMWGSVILTREILWKTSTESN